MPSCRAAWVPTAFALLAGCAAEDAPPTAGPGVTDAGTPGADAADGGPDAQLGAPIDLRRYLPVARTTTMLRHADGSLYSTYTYLPATPDFTSLYDTYFSLAKPGRLAIWAKGYGSAGCIATYAHLFLGDDGSVTEVGDYLANDGCHPSVAFGYGAASGANDGLAWSAAGGLPARHGDGAIAEKYGLSIRRQNNAGDPYLTSAARAWNRTATVEVLPTFRPAYGRSPEGVWGPGLGPTYHDVVRIVFWHGTHVPGQREIPPCTPDPAWPYGAFYFHLDGYHSYASEFYLAEGAWIIQESFLYTEDGGYWNLPDCVGLSIDQSPRWVSYIDQP